MIVANRPLPRRALLRRRGIAIGAIATILCAAAPATATIPTQSWNGWRWARTGPLEIQVGNNVGAAWAPLLASAATAWSAADNIDFRIVAGSTDPTTCRAVYGTVQACSGDYGANGWLGFANVWVTRTGRIVQGTIRLNDYYFRFSRYNTSAWRDMTVCHELGHTLGLAHTNNSRTNLNTGSCMDYTNDPSGTAGGSNGTLANVSPNSVDFAALRAIYANVDTNQLASTRPQMIASSAWGIDGTVFESFAAVPEPGTWLTMILGFGSIGAALRQRRRAPAGVVVW